MTNQATHQDPLFRSEALVHQKDRLYGEVLLLHPFSYQLMTGCAVALLFLTIFFLCWGTYTKKETVKGLIVPDKGIVKIFGQQQGIISKIYVTQGQSINEGDLLFKVTSDKSQVSQQGVETKLLQELAQSKQKYQDQIIAEKKLLDSEKSRLTQQQAHLQEEVAQIHETISHGKERIQLAKTRSENASKLKDKGHISQVDYQKIYEEYLSLQQQQNETIRAERSKQSAIKQIESEYEQLPTRHQARMNDIENAISDLTQKETEIAGRREMVIRAPVKGSVTSLGVHEGDWVNQLPLLSILPDKAKLEIELYIPSRAIGFIELNQTVRVRYDAFPHQRFGIYTGKISSISRNVLLPQELVVPIELKEPVYKVTVLLDGTSVQAYGKQFDVQPGMSLEADIVLDKRNILQWMLEPIYSIKGHL
jgi:membrane fusion protein